jgi:hypothetical protein
MLRYQVSSLNVHTILLLNYHYRETKLTFVEMVEEKKNSGRNKILFIFDYILRYRRCTFQSEHFGYYSKWSISRNLTERGEKLRLCTLKSVK